ncbi:MAG: DUF971 domain-containing protein [Planctomycetota bacterium]
MAHQPIQFGESGRAGAGGADLPHDEAELSATPRSLDLKKDEALTVVWSDGRTSVYPIKFLRQMSPSAEARALREEMAKNPLTVLPAEKADGPSDGRPFRAEGAELVGNYALRVRFSDGHHTGLYTWPYLRSIDPARNAAEAQGGTTDPDKAVRP